MADKGLYDESPGIVVFLGYEYVPLEGLYTNYKYLHYEYMEKMWYGTVDALIGNGDMRYGILMEKNGEKFRVIMFPCNRFTKKLKMHYVELLFAKDRTV